MKDPVKVIQNLPLLEERINNLLSLIDEKKELLNQWGISREERCRACEVIKYLQARKNYLIQKYNSDYKFVFGV